MTAFRRLTSRLSRRWTVLLVVALLASAGGAAAAAPVSGRLAGVTTIRWTGTAKIALTVPRRLDGFTEDRMRLFVSRGTYAFVRIVSPPSPHCRLVGAPVHCSTIRLDYTRDLATRVNFPSRGAGHDHLTQLPFDPSQLAAGRTTFFLFTDGTATLELRAPGLPGRAAYTARDRFHGRVARLPLRCASGACSPTSSEPLLFGGSAFDLGRAPGAIDTLVYSTTVDDTLASGLVPANQPHGLRQCVYPNYRSAPAASPDPADHPLGCDLAPQSRDDLSDATDSTANEVLFAYPYTGVVFQLSFVDVTGPRYAGWHAATAGPAPTIRSAYALWYSYTT